MILRQFDYVKIRSILIIIPVTMISPDYVGKCINLTEPNLTKRGFLIKTISRYDSLQNIEVKRKKKGVGGREQKHAAVQSEHRIHDCVPTQCSSMTFITTQSFHSQPF